MAKKMVVIEPFFSIIGQMLGGWDAPPALPIQLIRPR